MELMDQNELNKFETIKINICKDFEKNSYDFWEIKRE